MQVYSGKDEVSVEYGGDTMEGLRWRVFVDVLRRASGVALYEPSVDIAADADDDAQPPPPPPPPFATTGINEGHVFFLEKHCVSVDKPPIASRTKIWRISHYAEFVSVDGLILFSQCTG